MGKWVMINAGWYKILHGGWGPSKIARIGFSDQILRDVKGLSSSANSL